jgi:glycerophosphoryl diester phosphodiesterase
MSGMPRAVVIVSRLVSIACVVVLCGFAVFDAQAERVTAGRTPSEFERRLDPRLTDRYTSALGVAHNAGDELSTATEAAAYGAGAIEIDVRSDGGELFASHDAPLPFLEDVVFRGPSLQQAWDVAQLRPTVLLHLKEHSPTYLAHVRDFLLAQPRRHVIVQTDDRASLLWLQRELPWTQRLLLVLRAGQLDELRSDARLRGAIDGVSVRNRVATRPVLGWLQRRHLTTFVWTVNDETRMNDLLAHGIDGLITDRLDIMRLLG